MRFLSALILALSVFAQERADLILHNGKIFTADTRFSIVRALVVRGDRIVAVGDEDLLKKYTAPRIIDLQGRYAQPGFNDIHIHMHGDAPNYVELAGVKSIQQIRNAVSAKAAKLPKGSWITGYGWSEDEVEEHRKPTRVDLDQAAPNNPVALTRAGGHSIVANSKALAAAKLDRNTPDPDRGAIEHDAKGEPTGVVRERGDLFTSLVPKAGAAELRNSLAIKLNGLFAKGITSIIEANTPLEGYADWQKVYSAHHDTLPRAAVQIGWPGAQALKAFGKKTGDGDDHLRIGAIKVFVDGGFTGPAAYTILPYKGQVDYRGKLTRTPAEFEDIFRQANALGWQLGLHTIGDGAIQLAVDLLSKVIDENPRPDHRHYLNHFSMTPPDATYRKMAAHQIWIAQQPNFTYTLEGRYRDNLDEARLQVNNPVATPMKYNIFVGLSSDILPIGPLVGVYAAVTRKGMSGEVYGKQEAISIEKAIAGYTRNGAFFTREEASKGTLEPGKLADVIVLDEDLLTVNPAKILTAQVTMTILGGKVVYERK